MKHLQIIDTTIVEVQCSLASIKIMFAKKVTKTMVEQEMLAYGKLKLISIPLNLN
jgi:hypothetical protein